MTEKATDDNAKAKLPAEGGSFTRQPDGSLARNPAPKKPKRKSPAKPAEKEA